MAKIVEDVLLIKFSKIVKDGEKPHVAIVNDEVKLALEQVAQELVGENIVVEVVNQNGKV